MSDLEVSKMWKGFLIGKGKGSFILILGGMSLWLVGRGGRLLKDCLISWYNSFVSIFFVFNVNEVID